MRGLVLSGGGARGAYQAGVLKAVAQICDAGPGHGKVIHPFDIVTGVSAGALNIAHWAASEGGEHGCASELVKAWANLRSSDVFRVDFRSLSRIGWDWSSELMFGGLSRGRANIARSLLDTTPLSHLLTEAIDFRKIQYNLQSGILHSVAVTATDYATSDSITFIESQANPEMWEHGRRKSELASLEVGHLMASSAIPLLFPPIQVGERYFGDGCLRNTTPLGPAINLGAKRLLIASVRYTGQERPATHLKPSVARILSVLLNAVMLDGVGNDIMALQDKNEIVAAVASCEGVNLPLRHIDYVWIRPSQDLAQIALEESHAMPRMLKYLVGGLGTREEAAELISYLLFEPPFCRRLIELGYRDALAQAEAIKALLTLES